MSLGSSFSQQHWHQQVFSSGGPVPEFQPPEKWTAPYSPYAYGWWEAFFPDNAAQ